MKASATLKNKERKARKANRKSPLRVGRSGDLSGGVRGDRPCFFSGLVPRRTRRKQKLTPKPKSCDVLKEQLRAHLRVKTNQNLNTTNGSA
jgi:hypothetical protein